MPNNIVPVQDLDKMGLIADTPAVAIPPNSFSDCLNVRFRDGAVSKMQGEVNIFRDIFAENDVVKYVAWWPSPNLAQLNSGYYLVIVEREIPNPDGTATTLIRDQAFFIKPGDTSLPANPKGTFEPSGNWQHTFFQGGFALIINNGINVPQYVLDPEGNQDEIMIPDFHQLPGWDSYHINEEILNSDFDSTVNSRVFDAGQLVDFNANRVIVEVTTSGVSKEFTGPDQTSDGYTPATLPGTVPIPSGQTFEIYLDEATNTTVVVFGDGLITEDTVRVLIRSINPVQVRAGVIRSFGDFLVAGNLTERDETDLDVIVRSLPGVVRASDVAAPGAIPNNWNPFAAGTSTADEFVITQDGIVQDLVELQSNLYIYSNSSISVMRLTGNPLVPLSIQPITSSYGCLTTEGVLEFDGQHVIVGSQDIYLFGGHPGAIKSISDARVRDLFYERLNPLQEDSVFMLRYQQKDEIWICYASVDSLGSARDEALIWNYRNNTWTRRSLPGVYSGDIGPVPGGGLPLASIDLDGTSGNNDSISNGAIAVQSLPIDTITVPQSGPGRVTEYDIHVNADLPAFNASGPALFDIALPTDFRSGSAGTEIHMTFEGFTAPSTSGAELLFFFEVALDAGLTGNGAATLTSIKNSLTSNADFNANFEFIDVDQTEAPGEFVIRGTNQQAATTILNFGSQRIVDRSSLVRDTDKDLVGFIEEDPLNENQHLVQFVVPTENVGLTHYFNIDPSTDATVYGLSQGASGVDQRDYSDMFDEQDGDTMYGEGRGGTTARPEVGADGPQVMYRTRSGSPFTQINFLSDSFIPDIAGIYEFVIAYPTPTTLNSAVLEAYENPSMTDGTKLLAEPSGRSGYHSDAPVLTFETHYLYWTGSTDPELGYTEDPYFGDPDRVMVTLSGDFTDPATNRQLVADHLRDAFHVGNESDNSIWTTRTSESQLDTDAEIISTVDGAFQLRLVDVDPGATDVTADHFNVTRTQLGRWEYIPTVPLDNEYQAGIRQAVYPMFALTNNGSNPIQADTFLPRFGDEIPVHLDATNGNLIQSQIADLFATAMGGQDGWALKTKDTSNIGLVETSLIPNGLVPENNPLGLLTAQDIPAERPADRWNINIVNVGNTEVAETIDAAIPDATTDVDIGDYATRNTPSYLFLQIRDSEVTTSTGIYENQSLFIVEAPYNLTDEAVAEDWIVRIRRANPRLNITDGGTMGQFNIQPNNYSDLANFILVPTLNNTAGIGVCRDLLRASIYYNGTDEDRIEFHPASAIPFINVPQASAGDGYISFEASNGDLQNTAIATVNPDGTMNQPGVSLIFDSIRSWPTNEVNFNFEVPILAARKNIIGRDDTTNSTISRPVNKILGADIGWTTPLFQYDAVQVPDILSTNRTTITIQGNDQPLNYESYVERVSLGLSPEFDTEQLHSVALWTDGSTVETFDSDPAFNRLEVRATGTNNPGVLLDFNRESSISNAVRKNAYFISEDYKIDMRVNGRFLNLRVSDNITDTATLENPPEDINQTEYVYKDKHFRKDSEWRISGFQLEVSKAGTR